MQIGTEMHKNNILGSFFVVLALDLNFLENKIKKNKEVLD